MSETLSAPVRLNLGAGSSPLAGYINIDRSYCDGVGGRTLREIYHESGIACVPGEVFPLTNVDAGTYAPFADESVDEVRASHILEHFSHRQTVDVLREWVRVLKPGGLLKVAVPDFRWIVAQYSSGNNEAPLEAYLMGGHVDANDHHGAIFDEPSLAGALAQLGLVDIQRWDSEIADCASLPVSLNLMGRKPGGEASALSDQSLVDGPIPEGAIRGWSQAGTIRREGARITAGEEQTRREFRWRVDVAEYALSRVFIPVVIDPSGVAIERAQGFEATSKKGRKCDQARSNAAKTACELIDYLLLEASKAGHPDPQCAGIKITVGAVRAVMTAPRLGFTQMASCALNALGQWGISCETTFGVFWTHGMSDALTRHLDSGAKYLLTLDYDTIFDARDIQTLYAYMERRPDIDALCPIQSRREREEALFVGLDEDGNPTVQIPKEQMDSQAVMPIRHGHFGLTMLRVSALKDFPKPWFVEQPDAEGGYGDGRVDADVAFWLKWRESGRTLFLANRVAVGHLEHMIAWPGRNLLPIHQYASDYTTNGKPEGIWRS